MGYHKELKLAADWIASIQQDDFGWGLAPGQASSLVNTSEALYVLKRTNGYQAQIIKGLDYLKRNTFKHIKTRKPRIRYVAFSLLAFTDNRSSEFESSISECCNWLLKARNADNGWGTEANIGPSELFPTFLALWAMQTAGCSEELLEPSLQWILSKASEVGWCLRPKQSPSHVATAYALICLAHTKYSDDIRVRKGKEFLLQTTQWGPEEEVIAGTVWKHSTVTWVIPALILHGENPYSTVIAQGIRYINLKLTQSGGWSETTLPEGKTLRAQYWSVVALDAAYHAFDPSIHILRIDAERAQEALSEPEFVKFAVRSKWAVIMPSFFYRSFAYLMLFISFTCLVGYLSSFKYLTRKSRLYCFNNISNYSLVVDQRTSNTIP